MLRQISYFLLFLASYLLHALAEGLAGLRVAQLNTKWTCCFSTNCMCGQRNNNFTI